MKLMILVFVCFVGTLNAEVPVESVESSPSSGVQAGEKLQKKEGKSNSQGALTITLPVMVAPEYTVCQPPKENIDFDFDARLDLTSLSLSAIAP